MTNQETYFECAYCGQQYTNKQFQSLQSSFAQGYDEHDDEYGRVICGNCSKTNLASRSGGFDGPLTVQEKVEPSIFKRLRSMGPKLAAGNFGPPIKPCITKRPSHPRLFKFFWKYGAPIKSIMTSTPLPFVSVFMTNSKSSFR